MMIDILTYAWNIFRYDIRYICLLTIPFAFLAFLSYFTPQPSQERTVLTSIIFAIIYFLVLSMYLTTLIFYISQKFENKLSPVKVNLINGAVYAPLLVCALVIENSLIIASLVIIFIPMISHFIAMPILLLGIYISLKSTFAPFHLILEGHRPLAAIKASFQSTNGNVGKIVFLLIIFYLATSIIDRLTDLKTNIEILNMSIFFVEVAVTMLMVALQQFAVFKLYVNSFREIDK